MFSSDYKWQHDYVRLVSDTGFSFERHKPDNFDKNKISSVDIDRIIEEKDFGTIDKLIPSITRFVLDQEQARILDGSFVKTFLLSQLAIQYLLYCKKYLDNTLIIVKGELKKLKEENAELNLFVKDLKAHVSSLMKQIDSKPIFGCTHCDKIFSSEEFLNSHIKRRHSAPVEIETDKLQMEIKELKGRLNNAEKMIQKEQNDVDLNCKDSETKKIEDLQQKFEDLRLQVQSELKILQTQHNFQEKYEKLFEKVALQGSGKFSGAGDFGQRRESTTQTDVEGAITNVLEGQNKENIPDVSKTQKQMTEFGEALETKVTSSLKKIENQMQSFWSKLNEMDRYRKNDDSLGSELEKPKPVVRSRTKYSIKNIDPESEETSGKSPVHDVKKKKPVETEQPKKELKQPVRIVNVQLKKTAYSEETESSVNNVKEQKSNKTLQHYQAVTDIKKHPNVSDEIDSEIITDPDETTTSETLPSESAITADSSEKAIQAVKPRKPQPVPRKRQHSKTLDQPEFNDVIKDFTVEGEKIIMGRLQDLGVSPEWTGLPTRSFQRAMEIVNHQASLMKKTYPNFDVLSAQIKQQVEEKVEAKKQKKTVKTKARESKNRSSNKRKAPQLEIKNRSMYDTESDSEIKPLQVKETLHKFSVPYSAVIEELKAVTSKIESDKEVKGSVKTEDQTKGVLKSYPSVGSLTKKKVLFNLDTDEKKDLNKEGGSTTSVASSVFDGTPRKEEKKKDKEKDIEDLSDFDFSDM